MLAFLALTTVTGWGPGSSPASAAPLGAVDTAFGGGLVSLPKGTALNAAAVQRDGKLVVTGLTTFPTGPRLLVARFTSTGTLDASFGAGGTVTAPLPENASGTVGNAAAIAPDGRIVVAGEIRGPSGADGMLVMRLTPAGVPDTSFGSGGQTTLLRGISRRGAASALVLRADGEIVVGGASAVNEGTAATATVARLTPAGTLIDPARRLDIGEANIEGLALTPEGKIVIAGVRIAGQVLITFVGRLNADGTKDASFRDGGVFERSLARNGGGASSFRDVGIQGDGKIVATGYAFDQPGIFRITARFDLTGNPDASFGPQGVQYTAAARDPNTISSATPAGGAGLAIDGTRIYTGGSWDEFGSSALAIRAQNGDGNADTAFGTGGQTITPIRDYGDAGYGTSVALSPDGIYLVGTAGNLGSDTTTGVIVRYGAYPFSFPPGAGGGGGAGGAGGTPPPAEGGGPGSGSVNPPTAGGGPAPPPPDAGGPSAPPLQSTPPPAAQLSALSLSRKRISVSNRLRGSTRLSYRLSRTAKVRVSVEQQIPGRRKASRCVKLAKGVTGPRCSLFARVGSNRTVSAKAGLNRLLLTRKVTNRVLGPGVYRIRLQVLAGSAPQGLARTVTLVIGR